MKVSYFETARYRAPRTLPAQWPVPPDAYDREAGAESYRGMVERMQFVEELGFDWISVAEHHYSPNRLTPNPVVSAAHLAAYARKITIAVLGPIVSQSNPVKVAEELAMLDNMLPGRLVVGMLRGITGEYLTYGLNPAEARERTTEAMELVLKGLDRAATVWLAGPPLSVPHGRGLAASAAAAASADLRTRHQPRILRVCGKASSRARRLLCAVRCHRQGDPLLPRTMRGAWLAADARTDHLSSQHPDWRDRRRSRGIAGSATAGAPGLSVERRRARCPVAARHTQCRG